MLLKSNKGGVKDKDTKKGPQFSNVLKYYMELYI